MFQLICFGIFWIPWVLRMVQGMEVQRNGLRRMNPKATIQVVGVMRRLLRLSKVNTPCLMQAIGVDWRIGSVPSATTSGTLAMSLEMEIGRTFGTPNLKPARWMGGCCILSFEGRHSWKTPQKVK